MNFFRRQVIYPPLRVVICLIFIAFLSVKGYAQFGGPPTLSVPLSDTNVPLGGTAIFSVTAVSLLSAETFAWQLNGHALPTNCSVATVVLAGVGTSTLTVNNASATNSGVYTVKVTNYGGSITNSATLTILTSAISNAVSIVSSATGLTTSGFKLVLSGPSGSNCVIQASSDLSNWTPIATNTFSSGSLTYTDTSATVRSSRFYRAAIK